MHLIKLDRKIAVTQLDLSYFVKFDHHFQTLLQSLSKKYTVIYDAIDAQNISDVKQDLQKLQKKEAQLKFINTALWTNNQRKKKEDQ